jgi:replication factor C small subunit
MNKNINEYIWMMKYRPEKIVDVILPQKLRNAFNAIVNTNNLQNYLFSGPQGIGKTTCALALCKELGVEFLFINASNNRNIDLIRTTIYDFVSTTSWSEKNPVKVVILDEADNLNAESTQPALRAFIEESSANCRYILTANYPNKLISPLRSRFIEIQFSETDFSTQYALAEAYDFMTKVLNSENIPYIPEIVAEIVQKYAPEWRSILNKLQFHSNTYKKIDKKLLLDEAFIAYNIIQELFDNLIKKDFLSMRKWVANNSRRNSAMIYSALYKHLEPHVSTSLELAKAIHILAQYQFTNTTVPDRELNMAACFCDLMREINFV